MTAAALMPPDLILTFVFVGQPALRAAVLVLVTVIVKAAQLSLITVSKYLAAILK